MESKRVWEIDFFRAVAIVLMVIFHTVYDLNYFTEVSIDLTGFWYWEGKISALLFIFIAGISSGFSRNTVRRGVRVLAAAMLITVVTYIFFRASYIRFGILHLLGLCMIAFPIVRKMPNIALVLIAAAVALAAIPLKSFTAGTSLFLPFGAEYEGFVSLDYYPLSPYFSVFILGVLAYKIYYYKRQSLFKIRFENDLITNLSRNSLLIYLVHQPVVAGIILLLKPVLEKV